MKLVSTFNLNHRLTPRSKPVYTNLGLLENPITFLLADEFQQNLKDELRLAINKLPEATRYPLVSEVSLVVEVLTKKEINLAGVVKNIMDAGNAIIFTDDKSIKSIDARKTYRDSNDDLIILRVLDGKELRAFCDDFTSLEPFTAVQIEIPTIIEDRYLPYPPKMGYFKTSNPNLDLDRYLQTEMTKAYKEEVLQHKVGISIEMTLENIIIGDVDNLALNYLVNMRSIAYNDITQITQLHLRKSHGKQKSVLTIYDLG